MVTAEANMRGWAIWRLKMAVSWGAMAVACGGTTDDGGGTGGSTTSSGGTASTSGGGSSAGGTGGDGAGGSATGGGGNGGAECSSPADCKLGDDCCRCQSVPVEETLLLCPADCAIPACQRIGDRVAPLCERGRCILDINCDRSVVTCRAAEPDCPDGQVAAVVGQCWGPCVDLDDCPTVSDPRP